MDNEIRFLIRRYRRRLNALIVMRRAFAWAAAGAVASALVIAALRSLGWGNAGFLLWAVTCAAAASWGAAVSLPALVDERGAARWIDSRLGEDEPVSAAETCLRRLGTGRFDADVVARAVALAPRAASLRLPLRELAKSGAIAVAAVAFGAYAILLSAPIDFGFGEGESSAPAKWGGPDRAAAAIGGGGAAAAEFAASLFPDEKRMATLAERALREGRIDDFRSLLAAAGLELDSKLARSLREAERRKLTRDRERIDRAMAAVAGLRPGRASGRGGPGAGGGASAPSAGGGARPRAESDGGGEDTRSGQGRTGTDGADAGAQGSEGSGNAESRPRSGGGGGEGRQGGAAGRGEAAGRGGPDYGFGTGGSSERTTLDAGPKGERAVIPESKDASLFELVLPGEDIATSVGSVLPSSRKSAESAMSRDSLPLEYEDFIKSYFMALTEGEER